MLGTFSISIKKPDPLFFNYNAMHISKMPADMVSIFKEVCNYYNIDINVAVKKVRKREIVQTRQISMYFCKKFTKHSQATIGSEHGGKDHATVLHAVKTVNNLYDTDRRIRYDINTLDNLFKNKYRIEDAS